MVELALSEICDLQNGYAFKSSDYVEESKTLNCRMSNVRPDGRFDPDYAPKYLPDSYSEDFKEFLLKDGDLVIAMTDMANDPKILGVPTVVKTNGKSMLLNQRVGKLIFKRPDDIHIQYLQYALNRKKVRRYYTKFSGGGLQLNLGKKQLLSVKIPLPPLATQKKIAAILDAADAHRQKTKKLLAKYDELAQSIFLEMFGDPVTNPKRWEVKKMKEITSKIISGNTPKGGKEVYVENGILFLRSQNVWRNKLDLEDVAFIDEETHQKMKRSILKDGDILMTKTGRFNTENSSLGRAAMFRGKDGSANVNGHVYFMRPKTDVNRDFVLYILTTNQYRDYIRRICVGGIDKRQLNKDHLEDFPIIYPKRELQDYFTEKLKLINQQKKLLEKEDNHSNDLFKSLLQKAFQGELVK